MYLKNNILWVLLVASMGTMFAQTGSNKVEIVYGPAFRESKLLTLDGVIGEDETGMYSLMSKAGTMLAKSTYSLARFDKDMNLEEMREIDLSGGGKGLTLERVVMMNEKLLVFTSYTDKSSSSNAIYAQPYDKKSLMPTGDGKLLAEIQYASNKEAKRTSMDVLVSADRSKILAYYNLPDKKHEGETYGVLVYDDQFKEVWSKDVVLPYDGELFKVERLLLANDGDFFVMGKVLKDKKDRSKDEPDGRYIVLEYSENGSRTEEYDINIGDYFINSVFLKVNEQDEILCGGFYRNKRTTGTSGAFSAKIDRKTKTLIHSSKKDFPVEFISQDMGDKAAAKIARQDAKGKDVGIKGVLARELVRRDDGGMILIGEQYWLVVTTTRTSQGQTRTNYTYYYYDLIVVNINPDGDIAWAEKVPKRQVTSNDGGKYSSYASVVKDDKIYFVFNDNPKNLSYRGDGKWYASTFKKNYVALVEVDLDGRVFRETLLGAKGKGMIARPRVSSQIDDNVLALFAERAKNKSFMKVTFLR